MGTQNKFTTVDQQASKILTKNASESTFLVPLNNNYLTGNAMKTGKSQKDLTAGLKQHKDFRFNRVETQKVDTNNLVTKEQHEANLRKKEKGDSNKSSSQSKNISSRFKTSSGKNIAQKPGVLNPVKK